MPHLCLPELDRKWKFGNGYLSRESGSAKKKERGVAGVIPARKSD
jgi:hypothetical protein